LRKFNEQYGGDRGKKDWRRRQKVKITQHDGGEAKVRGVVIIKIAVEKRRQTVRSGSNTKHDITKSC